ncbi:MAG: GspH/FimT family pseudopilin [Pseudohongiellaceae bacterium]|nr:GspH/FimT family pseudopilin [Pseudohongiellaceae bacterium]
MERGVSLIELLITLFIMSILIMGTLSSGFGQSRKELAADDLMGEIMSALSMSRNTAIDEAITVTFCRSRDGTQCKGSWNEGAIIFTDLNEDHKLDPEDRLLFRLQPHNADGTLSFNSFQNRQYLQFNSRGFTKYQNGNFTFCASNKDPREHRQIILSLSGRTRYAQDSNGDGIREGSNGKPIKCKR